MAVMATQQPDVVAFEQKTMPVPSSDKMALDIDINGNSREANLDLDTNAPAPDLVPKTVEISPSTDFTSTSLELNAANNVHSFASNQTIDAPSIDFSTESRIVSSPLEHQTPSQLPETNTTTTDVQQLSSDAKDTSLLASDELGPEEAPEIESAVEMVITSALEDTAATSTVLPVIEAQESDLRDTTSTIALATEAPVESQQDTDVDTEFKLPTADMDGALDNPPSPSLTFNHGPINLPQPPSDAVAREATPILNDEQPTSANSDANDAEMVVAPESTPFTKISREREGDNDDEPSAKRTKTDEDTTIADVSTQEFQGPEVPAATQKDDATPVKFESTTISTYDAKEIVKILKSIVRSKDGKHFRQPVNVLWPSISDSYHAKISHPVDLATMEANLRDQKYATIEDFKAEVNLIFDNAVIYNGAGHQITASGQAVRDQILNKVASIPPESAAAPKPAKKQARQSTPRAENTPRATAARRQSRSGGGAPAISVAPAALTAQASTFALDPATNTPLIRRDSAGGRPKREIHPPKNKDLPYNTTTRPKNKKIATELRFAEEVLNELKKPKHGGYNHAFLLPVDPVSMNIPNYFQVIKHPMDISNAEKRLRNGEYQSAKGFESDMKLMFANCYKFNPPGNPVHQWGKQLEVVFNEAWATKNQWLADHAPSAQTPSSNGGSDEEESEEEEEVEDTATGPNSIAALSERLNEEQDKLITLMQAPKKDQQMIEMQNDMIHLIKTKIAAAKAKPATKKVVKKAKAPKPAKKQAPAKKAGAAATKRSAAPRQKYMGTHEKNIISLGIQRLPEDVIKSILDMIKAETDVAEGDDGEVELDIDVVSPPTLWKIYNLVMKHAPEVDQEAKAMLEEKEDEPPAKLAKPPAKKKNKPMSKSEQERKIEQLTRINSAFERQASGSQEPMPTVENQQHSPGDETSGDEDSDSEED